LCYNKLQLWEPLGLSDTVVAARGLIHEISILSPDREPAEPLARVAWVGEKQTSSPPAVLEHSVAGDDVDDIEERVRKAKQSPLDKLYDDHMAAKRLEPQVLYRPAIGHVLGVR